MGGSASNNLVLAPNSDTTFNVTSLNAGNLNGAIAFSNFAILTGGSGNDTFKFANGATITGSINGGGGVNTLDDSAYTTTVTANLPASRATAVGGTVSNVQAYVGGSNSGNKVLGPNADTVWPAANSGDLNGSIDFSGFGNLTGGTGRDTFKFGSGGSLTGKIDGGTGSNWLDYSALPRASRSTSRLGRRPGSGDRSSTSGTRRGGSGNDTLKGATLGSILIGGPGNDTIIGGAGRNLLIGGSGADTDHRGQLRRHPGRGPDSFDLDPVALDAIFAEWTRTDEDYATRVSHLLNGGGLNGSDVFSGLTVQDDLATDVLTGGTASPPAGSTNLDWFVANTGDTVTDQQPGETITRLP